MTDDLDTLRPEVREAINRTDMTVEMFDTLVTVNRDDYDIIRAELLRLAEDAAMFAHAVSLGQRYKQRAEKAEAELAEAQNTIAAQQGTMGALKRKLALAEGELAALKAAIAGSARVEVTLGCAIDGEIPPDLALCKVALVKTED